MRFLLLNQTFHPDVASTAQHLSDLASELAKRGHSVTVVTGRQAYDNRRVTFPRRENWNGAEIHRVYSTGYRRKTKWRRALDFASFMASCCQCLATMERHDVVVALTTPPLISFVGVWRARLWKSRFCYWVMDFNPDESIAAGWLTAGSLTAHILEKMSRFGLQEAHAVVALDRFMKHRIVAKKIEADKIAVIPPWAHDDEVRFDQARRNAFRQKHALVDKFVVMYSGNHSPIHPLDTLLQAAEILSNHPNIVFCFIGGGSEHERVKQWAEAGKANALCLPYQPLNQLAASLSAADLHVAVMGNPFVGLVHPCKIYNIFAVGSPLLYIGPSPSHVTDILNRLGDRYPWASLQHGDAEGVARQIERFNCQTKERPVKVPEEVAVLYSKTNTLARLVSELERLHSPAAH